MEQKKHPRQNQEQLSFSEQLRQNIINQPYDLAALWGRAADSFPQNKRKQRIRTTIAVVVGVVIGALAMLFLSSPDREGIDNMGMRKWLIQTFSVNNILHESQDLKNRILFEEVPSGQQLHLRDYGYGRRENR